MLIRIAFTTCAVLTLAASTTLGADDSASAPVKVADVRGPADGKIDFVRDVQPILQASCVECHSAENKKGRLRLDAKQFALAGGQSGKVLGAGGAGESLLVKRVTGAGGEKQMPFKRPPLPTEQVRILTEWVNGGAAWPDGVDGVVKEEKPHWAFVKPVCHDAPAVKQPQWVRNPIDAFVLAKLEREGLAPSAEAGRVELIRRATLDLVGLPPTLKEIDAFLADASPNAYEKVVDRLLASPHYGERWARQWLDVARYADTNGYEKDRPRNIWPYRDWVINAFNRDTPFDRFTVDQIAGDLLPDSTPEQVIATGFHRNTLLNEEGGIDMEEFRWKAVVDRVETTATAWLGLTLQCAQCHNHKYDPFTQKEYWQLFATLNNADEPEFNIPDPAIESKRAAVQAEVDRLTANLEHEFPASDASTQWAVLRPTSFSATGGATFAVADDGAVLVSGPAPQTDAYTFQVATADLKGVTSLRFEALTDPALPRTGPGRLGQGGNGNFVLTELKVAATGADGQAKPLAFDSAAADVSQGGFDVSAAFDGNPATGWAIDDGSGSFNKDRTATFQLTEPIVDGVTSLTFTVEQAYAAHTLGKFRISAGRPASPAGDAILASEDAKRQQHLAAKLTAWEQSAAAKAGRWTVVRPGKMSSRGHATMVAQADGSVLVSGDWPNNDVYELDIPTDLSGITAIKLEVLPDESLPENGPGRAPLFMPGDFMLSEFELKAAAAGGELQPVKPAKASHSFAADKRSAEAALDGRIDTGWSVGPRTGQAHQAVFALPASVGDPGAGGGRTRLLVTLVQQYIHQTTIGRFRISVTTDPQPAEATDLPADVEAILASTAAGARTAEQQGRVKAHFLSVAPELAPQHQKIAELRKSMPRHQQTMVMRERPPEHARATHLYHRGEFLQPRDAVTPGVPPILHPLPAGADANRLGLAKWLVDENNPLVGRVVMNRAWATFFGRGIVNTVQDFGLMGEPPSHPELLDWLATEFPKRGWSTKAMHRLIVTSATYRQDNRVTPQLLARDPGNVLLARGPRNRVEAEMVRDLALSVSGLLEPRLGGPSVFPPQPDGVAELSYGATPWQTSTGPDRWRRGLYTYLKRTSPYPAMLTFDAPTSDITCVRRPKSNTPLQALTLLNDKVFIEASQALARRVLKDAPADEAARARLLFRLCTGRDAGEDEKREVVAFYSAQLARFRDGSADASAVAVSEALPAPPQADLPELAAWTVVSRAILNLDETITK